ncbi:MAG: hypothetical protein KG075_16425 [Alphaproteobacteria bacterium]|nr:hypothetical protein [Alphaproteobacteria bacterium]
MKQSLFIGILLVFAGSGHAFAQTDAGFLITDEDFFNFGEAKRWWTELRTPEQFRAVRNAKCPANGPYYKWRKEFYWDKPDTAPKKIVLESLKSHDNAAEIKFCYDLHLAGHKWSAIAGLWRGGRTRKSPDKVDEASKACASIRRQNVFTGQCNDLPDWSRWLER